MWLAVVYSMANQFFQIDIGFSRDEYAFYYYYAIILPII